MTTVSAALVETAVTANEFRERLHERVLGKCSRTLLGLVDAVTTGAGACCCPAHLSTDAAVGHAAQYRALCQGSLDADALLDLTLAVGADLPRVYAIDTTVIPRPHARTSPDRSMQHSSGHNRRVNVPVVGWRYQLVVRLTLTEDSWVLPVMVDRVGSHADLVELTVAQIASVCARDGATAASPSLFLLDSGYPAARLTWLLRTRGIPADVLVRLASTQAFHTAPELRAAHPLGGRPRRHGLSLALRSITLRSSGLPPAASVGAPLEGFGQVQVRSWTRMHQKVTRATRGFADVSPLPVVEGTVLWMHAAHLRPSRRRGALSLFYSGSRDDLLTLALTYLRRFDVEHLFRFWKSTAAIRDFRPQQPESFTTWLRVHMAGYVQLFIARARVTHRPLPWERRKLPALTPGQVRRVVSAFLVNAWCPPGAPKPGHPGPGRAKRAPGQRRKLRKRYRIERAARK